MRILLTLLLTLITLQLQASPPDNELFKDSTEHEFCIRTEVGWNNTIYTSVGLSNIISIIGKKHSITFLPYGALELNYDFNTSGEFLLYAAKGGLEVNLKSGLLLGGEIRTMTDFSGDWATIITPKVGTAFNKYIRLTYGTNLFVNGDYFGIGVHQISLSFNITP